MLAAAGACALVVLAGPGPAAGEQLPRALGDPSHAGGDRPQAGGGPEVPAPPRPAPPAPASGSDSWLDDQTVAAQRRGKRARPAFGDRRLRIGMRGTDVRRLQATLTKLNFATRVDGVFGRGTRRNVRRYELWKEKGVDAVVTRKQARRMRKRVARGVFYREHVFPVRGQHSFGGAGSRFGAPRSGHSHMGQDVAAAEGTRLVAVHEGKVAASQYQAGGAGHYVVVRGRDGADSVYMHMRRPSPVSVGQKVMAGQRIGQVGTTGSSSGPHLHFELWTPHWYAGGAAYDPLKRLLRWDRRT